MTATYLPPVQRGQVGEGDGGKYCKGSSELRYGSRVAFVKGLDDLIAKPLLTMAQEFDRDMRWCDWKKAEYNLRDEFAYVCGPAEQANRTPGLRDEGNAGVSPEQFLQRVNEFIRERRRRGLGTRILEAQALLILDEVLAIRLCAGDIPNRGPATPSSVRQD